MADWKDMSRTAKNLTLAGLGKAKQLGDSAKLNLEILSEEENKKRVYMEIGKRMTEQFPEAPEGFEALYAQLQDIEAKIQERRDDLNDLRHD